MGGRGGGVEEGVGGGGVRRIGERWGEGKRQSCPLDGDLMVCWTKLVSMTREFKVWFSLVPRLCSLQDGSGNQTRYS